MRFRDLLMSAAAIALLMALIALTDDRVRERMQAFDASSVSYGVVSGSGHLESVAVRARDFALDNGVLAGVVIAGAVLCVFMLRT